LKITAGIIKRLRVEETVYSELVKGACMKIKIFLTVLIVIIMSGLSGCSPKKGDNISEGQQQIGDLQLQLGDLQQQVTIDDLKLQLGDLKQQIANAEKDVSAQVVQTNAQIAQAKDNNPKYGIEANNQTDKAQKFVPQADLTNVSAPARVNILLVDEFGRVPDCFKGVLVSDVTQNGKHTHFMFDGKPIDWNQKVMFSYSYTDNEPPITGAIVWTPKTGEASKVINIPPCNIYQDSDGTIRYDDGAEKYPIAPEGSAYITTQSVLRTQP